MMINEIEKYKRIIDKFKCCVIIPTYNNSATLADVINGVIPFSDKIIVVNDGSTDNTEYVLSQFKNLKVINISKNKGKGNALKTAFRFAFENGFKYAVTIDSDGQHLPESLVNLLDKLESEPGSMIIGSRNMSGENVPGKSSFGHKFSNFWFRFETGIKLPDTQSGFRLYPLEPLSKIRLFTNRFEYEIESIVRLAWSGIKITSAPVNVIYLPKEERVSHFRPFTDFARISVLNTILVLIAVFVIKPFKFAKNLSKENIKKFLKENIINSKETNLRLALSVAWGVFAGIVPIWGWQLAFAITFAYIFRLNKVIVITAANISIPPNIPIILFLSYKTGGLVLGHIDDVKYSGINFEFVKNNILQYVTGAVVFAFIASIFLGALSLILMKLFRKNKVLT